MANSFSEGKYNKQSRSRQALKRALERLFPAHDFAWRDRARYTVGRCPWHDDQHPSLSIFQAGQGWRFRCHACGKAGDLWSLRREAGEALPAKAAERLEKREKLGPALFKAALLLQEILLEEGCPWLDGKVPGWKAVVEAAQEEGVPLMGLYPAREELGRRLEKEGLSLEELSPYLWPVRENGEPWDLEGWLAWFQGRPGEVCRVRVRRPGSRERLVLEVLDAGGLVGLQLWPRNGRAQTVLLVEGETDWLAVQARALEERKEGAFLPSVATGSASAVGGAVKEVLPWLEETGILFYWPDFDLKTGKSPGLMAGLEFLKTCREERVYGEIVFPPEYETGSDPCDYLRDHALLLSEDALKEEEYLERVEEFLLSSLPEVFSTEARKVLHQRLLEALGEAVDGLGEASIEAVLDSLDTEPREETRVLGIEVGDPKRVYNIVISATTGVGKSTFVSNLVVEALEEGKIDEIHLIGLEMSPSEYLEKVIKILKAKYDLPSLDSAKEYAKNLLRKRLRLYHPKPQHARQLVEFITNLRPENRRVFVIIDPVQTLIRRVAAVDPRFRDPRTAGEDLIDTLSCHAQEAGLGMVYVSEMGRETGAEISKLGIVYTENREEKIEKARQIALVRQKETGGVENKAVQLYTLLIWRFVDGKKVLRSGPGPIDDPLEAQEMLLLCAKDRHGPPRDTALEWVPAWGTIVEKAKKEIETVEW